MKLPLSNNQVCTTTPPGQSSGALKSGAASIVFRCIVHNCNPWASAFSDNYFAATWLAPSLTYGFGCSMEDEHYCFQFLDLRIHWSSSWRNWCRFVFRIKSPLVLFVEFRAIHCLPWSIIFLVGIQFSVMLNWHQKTHSWLYLAGLALSRSSVVSCGRQLVTSCSHGSHLEQFSELLYYLGSSLDAIGSKSTILHKSYM